MTQEIKDKVQNRLDSGNKGQSSEQIRNVGLYL